MTCLDGEPDPLEGLLSSPRSRGPAELLAAWRRLTRGGRARPASSSTGRRPVSLAGASAIRWPAREPVSVRRGWSGVSSNLGPVEGRSPVPLVCSDVVMVVLRGLGGQQVTRSVMATTAPPASSIVDVSCG
ncbi:hypothetical protein HBB16_10040 [Pseudonocardia sp. MCCB 268]|nr:hypothetical protein [Pseudonocardia cytotoxica]